MLARDIMTRDVVTASPDTPVQDIARMMLERRISAVPIVDGEGHVLGIVSEGDLIRRAELGSAHRRSWWLELLSSTREIAREFLKEHGRLAEHVMTTDVITVDEDTPVSEIARILEENHIKRVPVLADGRLVGIVSRADLLRALVAQETSRTPPSADDRSLRERILETLREADWLSYGLPSVVVHDGVVELWGLADSEEERKATVVAVQETPGVRKVIDHIKVVPLAIGRDGYV